MIGSHIDTVIDAGVYDGCYGVLAGLEVLSTLRNAGFVPSRPIAVAAFTNEEGVRYAPDMMGSLVYAGGLAVEEALAAVGTDGTVLGEELARIGYAGPKEPGFLRPQAYVELHVEQGPILEREGVPIGAVESLQGISWQRVTIEGVANHAGTTPMSMRRDAGQAAARVVTFLRDRVAGSNASTVATVGCMGFEPNAINVIPSRATFTVDLRDPDEGRLREAEASLARYLDELALAEGVSVSAERLARSAPVSFDQRHRRAGGGRRRAAGSALEAHDLRRRPRRADDGPHLSGRHDLRAQRRRDQPQPARAHPGPGPGGRRQRAARRRATSRGRRRRSVTSHAKRRVLGPVEPARQPLSRAAPTFPARTFRQSKRLSGMTHAAHPRSAATPCPRSTRCRRTSARAS